MSVSDPLHSLHTLATRLNEFVASQPLEVRKFAQSILALRNFSRSPAYGIALRRPQALIGFAHAQLLLKDIEFQWTGSDSSSDRSPASVTEMRDLIEVHVHRLEEQRNPLYEDMLRRPIIQAVNLTAHETEYMLNNFPGTVRMFASAVDPDLYHSMTFRDLLDGTRLTGLTSALIRGTPFPVSGLRLARAMNLRVLMHDAATILTNNRLAGFKEMLPHFRRNSRQHLPGGRERLPKPLPNSLAAVDVGPEFWESLPFHVQDLVYFLIRFIDDYAPDLSSVIQQNAECFYVAAGFIASGMGLGIPGLFHRPDIDDPRDGPRYIATRNEQLSVLCADLQREQTKLAASLTDRLFELCDKQDDGWLKYEVGLRWLHNTEMMPVGASAAEWNAAWFAGYSTMFSHHRTEEFEFLATEDFLPGPVSGALAARVQATAAAAAANNNNNNNNGSDSDSSDDDWTKFCLYCCKRLREPNDTTSSKLTTELKLTLQCCGGTVGAHCLYADCAAGRARCPLCNRIPP